MINSTEFSKEMGIKPNSVRVALSRHGHYCGIYPYRNEVGRLMFPDNPKELLQKSHRLIANGYLISTCYAFDNEGNRYEVIVSGNVRNDSFHVAHIIKITCENEVDSSSKGDLIMGGRYRWEVSDATIGD